MSYEVKSFSHLTGIKGLSDELLKNHITLYQGYVMHTNKFNEAMMEMVESGREILSEFAELKRRFGFEWNGMRLHEYYFMNMSKEIVLIDKNSSLLQKIMEDYGSYERWEREFRAVGMMRGIGWTIAYYDPVSNKILNVWINEHHTGHLAGLMPILVMDCFEHAYMTDYGLKRADYIEVFFKLINWEIVSDRFDTLKQMEKVYAAMNSTPKQSFGVSG